MQSFQPGLQNTLPLDQVLHNQSKCVVYGSPEPVKSMIKGLFLTVVAVYLWAEEFS